MADLQSFGDFIQSQPPPRQSFTDFVSAPKPPAQPGILESALTTAGGIVKGTATLGWHTLQSLLGDDEPLRKDAEDAVKAQADQWAKAKDALNRGDRVEAAGHGMAALLPFVGPGAAHVGETAGGELRYDAQGHPIGVVRDPNVRGAIGEGAVLVGSALAPEVTRRAAASPTVGRVVEATGAGVKAAAPDVAAGTAKVGVGVGAHYLPIPAEVKYGVGIPSVGIGARQIARGLKTGVAAARASFAETAPIAATAAPVVEATPLQLGPGPIITPAPPDTSFVRSVPAQYAQPEPIPPSRQLGPGPIIPPPPADTSFVRAVPAEYPEVDPGFLEPEVNQMPPAQAEAVVAKARAARTARKPAAAATEPTQPPPATPPAQPQSAADFMRAPTPGQAYAASQGYDWSKLSADDRAGLESVAQAQANMAAQGLPITPPNAAAQSATEFMHAPATELESQLADSLRAAQEGKQAAAATTTEAPAPKPENVYVKNARLAKAVRVADAAQQLKITSRAAYDMITDEAKRQKFAEDAGEKSISSDTMAMVVDKLRRREADAVRK